MSNKTSTASEQRCFKVNAEASPPLIQNGKIVLQTYHIGFIISGALALVAMITSFWLISKHLQWYTNKREQRYIVRLLFMVPLYAAISFLSFLFWNHSTPIILIRDAYEAIVLTAFFYLLLMYISHDAEEQKRVFVKAGLSLEADAVAIQKGKEVGRWVFPLGFVKWKPKDGLYFLQLMKWGVLQYCVIRPTTTLAAVILNYVGLYCESSWGLGWGHIYITIIMSLSVTVAMFCLIQLYVPVAKELSVHKPLLKLFSVKAVVFLTFWQATFLSVLSMFGIVKDTKYMTAEDVNIGIGAVLECFEMMIFGFVHILAFTYKPYAEQSAKEIFPLQTPRWRSLRHAMDFRETFREIWVGCVYMFDHMRGREPTPDFGVIRETHYEGAFGRQRPTQTRLEKPVHLHEKTYRVDDITYPAVEIEVERKVEIEVNGHIQWLQNEKDRQRITHPRREKSEGLQEQIDKELERLGYLNNEEAGFSKADGDFPVRQRSWWRNIYNHISQPGHDVEEEKQPFTHRRPSRWGTSRPHPHRLEGDTLESFDLNLDLDDHPPRSILYPPSSRLSRDTGVNHDDNDDRRFDFEDSDHPSASNSNDLRQTAYHLQDRVPFSLPRVPSEYPNSSNHVASSRPSRSHRAGPVSPMLERSSPSASHNGARGPRGPISPVRSPLRSGNTHAYLAPESLRSPTRVVPVMPLPLVQPSEPYLQQRGTAQHATPYDWKPPPIPLKDAPEPMLLHQQERDLFVEDQRRKSTHRREPAAAPSSRQDRRREPRPLVRGQHQGPSSPKSSDPRYIAHTNADTTVNGYGQ